LDALPLHEADHARIKALLEARIAAQPAWARHYVTPVLMEGTAPGVRWGLPYEEVVREHPNAALLLRKVRTALFTCHSPLT
jgi:hypothetical protein